MKTPLVNQLSSQLSQIQFFQFFGYLRIVHFVLFILIGVDLVGQVAIIPKLFLTGQNAASGTSGWVITNAPINNASTDYWKMISTNAMLETPAMNLDTYSNESCTIKLGTFGAVNAAKQTITITISTNNGLTWSALSVRTPTSSSSTAMAPINLSTYTGTQVKLRFANLNGDGTTGVRFFEAYLTGVPTPTISASTSLSIFTASYGSTSASQSLSISGSNLTANIIATAPNGIEVSSDGSTYGSTAAFSQSSGLVSGILYIRLAASAAVATYNSQNIVLSSTGANSVNLTTTTSGNEVTAIVPSAPTITGITPNNTQLSVDFNAPTSNGGASITNYIYSIDNGSTWMTPNPGVTSSPLVISNLNAGSTYDVQIKALNSVGSGAASNTVTATIPTLYTWTGTTSTNWSTSSNWNPTGIPDGSIDISIPNSTSLTNSPVLTSLTINSGKTLTLQSGAKLTVSGLLTNNGTVTIENGATLVQTGSGSNAGSGTYNVKQTISGSGGATPNGRYWYLGSPLSNGSSVALLSSTGNQLWQWDETNVNYSTMSTGLALIQGKSYVLRSGQATETITFSGSGLSNGSLSLLNLSRTGTTAQFRGCHLVSNPYPSYLDWDLVGKTNVSTTMYVRTALGSNYNILETYNSFDHIGTSISGTPMTKDIAPMQGFWVKVIADGQTGSLALDNSMRSHQANGSGLRSSTQDFPAFLRFNLIDGENKDQVILFMSPDASGSFDEHDSEKMLATGSAQLYSTVNAKKLVINGMNNVKAKTSIPLTLDLPSSKSYVFNAEELNIEDGLILLEDKQEGVIQDLTINPEYSFFGNAGNNPTRFVIHFQLANAPILVGGPSELEILGTDELTAENIQINSDIEGLVTIRLEDGFKPEGFIKVHDASGRLIEQRAFIHQEETLNFFEKSGIYFIQVRSGKVISQKKIVILH